SSPLPVIEEVDQQHPVSDPLILPTTPPKKLLRLNASGKFSSPIRREPKDAAATEISSDEPKRKGRSRKAKQPAEQKTLIVKIPYAQASSAGRDVGQVVHRILHGEERVDVHNHKLSPKKPRTPRKSGKATHPFFAGKPNELQPTTKQESPRKASATTPGKLKTQIWNDRLSAVSSVKEVPYAVGSGLLKDRLIVKHPGAKEPAWPAKETAHVRGVSNGESALPRLTTVDEQWFSRTRKRKAVKLPVPSAESVLTSFRADLVAEPETVLRSDGFEEPHRSLQVPDKLLITGDQIRQRIRPEIAGLLPDDLDIPVSLPSSSMLSPHPALRNIWDRIPTTLTAFDESRGENLGWTHKYAPSTAAEVLQPAQAMSVLKTWLTSLTVTAVESAPSAAPKPLPQEGCRPKKKRRRKHDEMDDFLVDSDEEIRNMDELTDPGDAGTDGPRNGHKSMVQVALDGVKLSNAVLLSGPHGSGKTAAAYAVAREQGFKVFEISPSERRSGKDILARVGDMTENHLVKHHGLDAGEVSSTEEPNNARLEEEFQRDLACGRQGKMNAFFKPQANTKPTAKKKQAARSKTLEAVKQTLRKPSKDQQQSLVLLEEVDILFKDDKEFWSTVLKLIVSSKRPFIMTCNDEDLVPLQAMNLHAILRFTPPSVDLAADYLLLVAAAEGHLLKRQAVCSLYQAKGRDLRATLTELDFWCQMGVGDPRCGLGWLYQRWPPGSDVDETGRKLRVVSDGTYRQGVGLVHGTATSETDKTLWSWREFGLEPLDFFSESNKIPSVPQNQSNRYASVRQYAWHAGIVSALDTFTAGELPETARLDTTQPQICDKARRQYVEGMQLMQVDEHPDYFTTGMEMVARAVHLLSATTSHQLDDGRLLDIAIEARSAGYGNGQLERHHFAVFDAISAPAESALSTGPGLLQSAFDGPLAPVAVDLAPYVRSIVQYDLALEEQRERLSRLLENSDGQKNKRARTTRAARSALEGSQRASTRRERWFTKILDLQGVLSTGGTEWPKCPFAALDDGSVEGSREDQSED
ncbi:hypothetical protein BAUCODRAFT_66650, partial [Baudoinia panamericana UAMH 10762]